MDIQHQTNLLCLLITAKENKAFYKLHKREINLHIRLLKENISSEGKNQEKTVQKKSFKDYSVYIIEGIRIVTEFLKFKNSS